MVRVTPLDGRPVAVVTTRRGDRDDAHLARRVAGDLATLLQLATGRRDEHMSNLHLLDPVEFQRVVVEWNATDTSYPRRSSVPELFERWVDRSPDAPALRYGEQTLSYRELDRRANRLAHHLRRLAVGPESLVGLCFRDTISWVVGALATVKAGAAYLPLDPAYPKHRLDLMCRDAAPQAVLYHSDLADRLVLDAELDHRLALSINPDQLAYVMYTSGSTGKPKGTGVSHRNVVRLVRDTDFVDVRPSDVMAQASNMSFDAATLEVWGALLNGACLAGLDLADMIVPERLSERLADSGVTMMFLATSVARQLAMDAPESLQSLRYLTFGGEQADRFAVERLLAHCPRTELVNGYGPTEGTTYTTTYQCVRLAESDQVVPIGRPVANTRVYVLDRYLQPVAPGLRGELYIGGDGVARGYLGQPGQTAERFVPDPFAALPGGRLYRTGDLVQQRDDGVIEFVERADQQVKIRGYRVEPGEVTQCLRGSGLLRDVVVRADRDAVGEARLVAYVVLASPGDPGGQLAQVRQYARERLPDYLVPAAFVSLPRLPLNQNGKIDMSALPPAVATSTVAVSGTALRTATERAVAEIWQDVLGVAVQGRDDDFFDLGGRSLKATRVRSRLSAVVGVELPLRLIFDHPTLAALAAAADEATRVAGVRPGEPVTSVPPGPAGAGAAPTDLIALLDRIAPQEDR